MSDPVYNAIQGIEAVPQSSTTKNNVSIIKTLKVGNISLAVSDRDIREFFSFSGDIQYMEVKGETEKTQLAYVTFKDSQGADTAILLSGATIGDLSVSISPAENYQLPPEALRSIPKEKPAVIGSAVDVVSTMLAKGFILGKDAINKAKAFDERHNLTSNASAKVVSIDQKMGLMEKLSVGTAVVNEKVREMDQRFMVSEKTKSAFAVAEQKVSGAGSAIISNPYVVSGASWVSNALGAIAKAAQDVSTMTKEKVERAEEEKNEMIYKQRTCIISDFAQTYLDESSAREPSVVPINSLDDTKPRVI